MQFTMFASRRLFWEPLSREERDSFSLMTRQFPRIDRCELSGGAEPATRDWRIS